MRYELFFEAPQRQFIRIQIHLAPASAATRELWLSKWRPGRYELADYSEKITEVRAMADGQELPVLKTAYNHWQIQDAADKVITFEYRFHAVARDAGSSWYDETHVYINGVNLFMYEPTRLDQACAVRLHLPESYRIACGLRLEGHTLQADDFHQLVDAPLIASDSLQHHHFDVAGTPHHLWFQGTCRPDFARIRKDFGGYSRAMVRMFGDFPVEEYHYLFQIHNKHFYHGVEHYNSTVIALGPGYKLMEQELYEELLGVSCHELFHTWNVKAIRPADMRPYRYDAQNYSRLHYVTEGVTTYYGDLMLMKGGVWELENYLRVFNNSVVKRHYANNGRDYISLEEASFDSWLWAYKPGVPNRKISFYTKGALAAFILDQRIRAATQNARSLDTVMRQMYEEFGKTHKGYTREDYKRIAEAHCGHSLDEYFRDFISGTVPMEDALSEAGKYFGLSYTRRLLPNIAEKFYGFTTQKEGKAAKVKQVYEGSPAEAAGLRPGDELVALNGMRLTAASLELQLKYFGREAPLEVTIFRDELLQMVTLQAGAYRTECYMFSIDEAATYDQLRNREAWMTVA